MESIMRELKNIYLDLDGPILDVSQRHYEVYKSIINSATTGVPLSKKSYWELKRMKTPLDKILETSGVSMGEHEFLQKWLSLIELMEYLKYDNIIEGSIEAIHSLKKRARVVLVTLRRIPKNLKAQLEHLNILPLFDEIFVAKENIGSFQVKVRLIKEDRNFSPFSLVIGDSEVDILAGKNLGLRTIAVLSGIRSKEFLEQYKPDYLFLNLKEVSDFILTASCF